MLSYIDSRLPKATKEEIAEAAITRNPRELSCLSDPVFVEKLFYIKKGPATLEYLYSSLKNNQQILTTAILRKPTDIRFIENKEFVLALFADPKRIITLEDLHPSLQTDNDIITAALKKDPANLSFIQDLGFVIGLFAAIETYAQKGIVSSIFETKPVQITLKDVHPAFKENDDVIAAAYKADKKNIQYADFASIITFLQHTPKALQYIEDTDVILTIFHGRYNLSEFTLNDIHESLRENPDIKCLAESKIPKLHNEEGTSKKLAPADSKGSSSGIVAKALTALDAKVQEMTAPEEIEAPSKTPHGDELV